MSAPKYRWIFQPDTISELEFMPVNSHTLSGGGVSFQDTGEVRVSREIGDVLLTCSHNRALYNILKSAYAAGGCDTYVIRVHKFCKNAWTEIYNGQFNISQCSFDFERCRVSIKPKQVNPNDCIVDKGGKELNMFSLVAQEDRVSMGVSNAFDDGSTTAMEFYSQITIGNGIIAQPDAGYTEVYNYLVDSGTNSYLRLWARPKIILECGSTVPSTYTEIIPCSVLGDVGIYTVTNDAQTIYVFNNTYVTSVSTFEPVAAPFHINEYTFGDITRWFIVFQYPPAGSTVQQIPNGVRMMDLIRAFVNYACPEVPVESLLFDDTESEYITGATNYWRNIVFFDASDAKNPNATEHATKHQISLSRILKELKDNFQVYWSIIEGVFTIEHISWWKNYYEGTINLSYIKGYNVVTFAKENSYKRHTFNWSAQQHIDVVGIDITYSDTCVGDNSIAVNSSWITDWYYVLNYPDSGLSGLFVAACGTVNESNQCAMNAAIAPISNTILMNGHLAWSFIHSVFHLHERSSQNVYINGQLVPARSVKKSKQITISFQNKCFDIDVEKQIFCQIGVGEINSWTYKLDNNLLTLKLLV